MELTLNEIQYIIQECKNRLLLTEISNNAIETLFKKYCEKDVIRYFDYTLEHVYYYGPCGLNVDRLYIDKYPNMKLKDYMRLKLMEEFGINRGRGPIKYFRGIIRICCSEPLTYFKYPDRDKVIALKKIISYICRNNITLDEELNGLTFEELYEGIGKDMRIHDIMSWKESEQGKKEYGEYTVIPMHSYADTSKYKGYTTWCVTSMVEQFNSYTSDGSQFFFCLKKGFENVEQKTGKGCPLDEYGLSMVSVLIHNDNSIKLVTTRWNHSNNGENNPKLKTFEQIEEVLGIPRDVFVNSIKPKIGFKDIADYLLKGGDIENVATIEMEGKNGVKIFSIEGRYNACIGNKLLYDWYDNYRYFPEDNFVVCYGAQFNKQRGANAFDVNGRFFPEDIKEYNGKEIRFSGKYHKTPKLFEFYLPSTNSFYLFEKGNMEPVFPFTILSLTEFHQGLGLMVVDEGENKTALNFMDENHQLLWKENKDLTPHGANCWSNSVLKVYKGDGIALYDMKAERYLNDDVFESAQPFGEYLGIVRRRSDYCSNLIKRDGTYVSEEWCLTIHDLKNGYYLCHLPKKDYIIIDYQGNIPMNKYWYCITYYDGKYGIVSPDFKHDLLIDGDGNTIFKTTDILINIFGDKIVRVDSEDNYEYFIDVNGKLLTPKSLVLTDTKSNEGYWLYKNVSNGEQYKVYTETGVIEKV